jgi:DNA repair exonuclease SbcCD ATPase subunit
MNKSLNTFTKLRWKNFLSYGKNFTEISLDLNKIVNIIGKNGKGKSIFIDAFHFALTGKPFRKVKMSEIPNTINKKNCIVELELMRGKKKVFIRRGLNPKIFEIKINNKLVDEDSRSLDQQEFLEKLLGFNSKTLRHTIIMSSMNYSPFLKMAAIEKRLFIDDILNISDFTNLSVFVKKRFSLLQTKISDVNITIERLESNLEIIKDVNSKFIQNSDTQIEELKENIKELKNKIDDIKYCDYSDIQKFEKEINKLNDLKNIDISELKTEHDKEIEIIDYQSIHHIKVINEKLKEILTDNEEKYNKKIDGFKEKQEKQNQNHQDLKDNLDDLIDDYHQKSEDLQISLSEIKTKISKEEDQKYFLVENSECPTCRRLIDKQFKDEAFDKLKTIIESLNKNKQNTIDAIDSLAFTKAIINDKKEKIYTIENKISDFNSKINEFKSKYNEHISDINSKYNELKSNKKDKINAEIYQLKDENSFKIDEIKNKYDLDIKFKAEELQKIKSKRLENHNLISIWKETIRDYNKKIEQLNNPKVKEVKDESKVLDELNENRKNLEKLNDKKKIYEISIKLLSDKGFKRFVINKYIPVLNTFVNKYLDLLEAHYRLKFDPMFDVQIVARGYENLSYESFSSGERARCDLALLFAFIELSKLKNSIESNLLVLDEVADNSLDSNGVYGVINIISQLKIKGITTYVISHREEIADEFDMTLEAKKELFSSLEII